jgi:hypothetical protein
VDDDNVLLSLSAPRSSITSPPLELNLPLAGLEILLFLLCLGLFDSALKLRGLGGVMKPFHHLPIPNG